MTSPSRTSGTTAAVAAKPRLSGVDLARSIALLGMMATHIVPLSARAPDGSEAATWAAVWFAGKASALFAVLAGVGLALLTGGPRPRSGPALGQARRGIAVRALLVAAVGMSLGLLDAGVAVILVHYGVLFLLALPFLGLALRRLAWWAAGWLVLSPVALYLLLQRVPGWVSPHRVDGSPVFTDLSRPATLAADLFVTGYYPAVTWLGFVLLGLAVGRLALSKPFVALALAAGAAAVAALAKIVSAALVALPAAQDALLSATGRDPDELALGLVTGRGLGGIESTPWWFAVSAPHTGAPLDLLHVGGTAVAVLGACLLVASTLRGVLGGAGEALMWPLTGAGAATLSLYTAHLVALDLFSGVSAEVPRLQFYLAFVVAALLAGIALKWADVRGPLETAVHAASAAASGGPGKGR